MPRKKKVETIEKNKENKESEEFIYCGWRKCTHTECLRHNVNTPFGVLILRSNKFKPDIDWNCKDMVI